MRWFKRLLTALALLGVVGAIVYAFLPQPVPADLGHVTRGSLRVTVDEDGKTRVKSRYTISAPLNGRVQRLQLKPGQDLEPGDEVREGELLAIIEPVNPELLDARAATEAEIRIRSAQAAVERSEVDLQKAQTTLEFARNELQRLKKVATRDALTKQELEDAVLREQQRSAEQRGAQFAVQIAKYELDQAQAALLRTRPTEQSEGHAWNFKVVAPISGRVLRVMQESAKVVTPGTPLVELGDPQDLEVVVDVLSSDGVRIPPRAKVEFDQWGGEQPLHGIVRLVEPGAFTKVSALGVEEQRVNVIIDLLEPPAERPNLGDAYRVDARIVIWEEPNVLRTPTSSLFRDGEEWAVFCVRDGRAHRQRVKIGKRNGLDAQVLEGLSEGDIVIVHPSDRVADGVEVVPR
ncbi:MAG TPA: HlyD family efflux transporter periplasmic adaptor subunit [Planctomycetaceae bacterium]|nr:HlyD family efflux transporter periplasmic adaptor subunit [Planctomycetaceae bacterium]